MFSYILYNMIHRILVMYQVTQKMIIIFRSLISAVSGIAPGTAEISDLNVTVTIIF